MKLRITIGCLVLCGMSVAGASKATAQTHAISSGSWTAAGTWGGGVPTATPPLPAFIGGGYTVGIGGSDYATSNLVDVGTVADETGTLNVTSGVMFVENQEPGTNFAALSAIRIGQAAGSTGSFNVSGGTVFVTANGNVLESVAQGDLMVGDAGTGTATVTGGEVTVQDELFLGFGAGSKGTLNVSNGKVETQNRNLLVGFSGQGELNLSATGQVRLGGWLFSSFWPSSTSTINQSGGSLEAGAPIVLARQGNSTYNHTGGSIATNLFILSDNYPTNAGAYPAPGSLNVPGSTGTYKISGTATLDLTNILWLGAWGGGHGIVEQTGGTITAGAAAVGRDGTGTYNMSAGQLNLTGTDPGKWNNHLIVGRGIDNQVDTNRGTTEGDGTFVQTGGTVNVATNVFLGDFNDSDGTYKISGGVLNVTRTSGDPVKTGNFNVGAALNSWTYDKASISEPTGPDDSSQAQSLNANGTLIVSGSAATINVGGNFLANPADKSVFRRDACGGGSCGPDRDNSATLGFEIFNASGVSLIHVAGTADLDGAVIDLDLMNGFVPTVGTTYDLLTAANFGATGTGPTQNVGTGKDFTLASEDIGAFSLAVVAGGNGQVLRATFLSAPAGVAGDYNSNGVVDAADYTVWRNNLGGTSLPNDGGVSPGVVDQADFVFWKSRFGATSGSGSASLQAVPEPGACLLLVIGCGLIPRRLRRRAACALAS